MFRETIDFSNYVVPRVLGEIFSLSQSVFDW